MKTKMKTKATAAVLVFALVLCFAIGGTLAWLTDKTEAVKNTFTVGAIDIELTETTTDYKMIPGTAIAKDPKVTVKAGSEDCWLFVKVAESDNLDQFISYTIDGVETPDDPATPWTPLDGVEGVYYREIAATTADISFDVLAGNQVTVNSDVVKEDLNALTEETFPTLTFTAYAVQKAGFTTATAAWAEVSA